MESRIYNIASEYLKRDVCVKTYGHYGLNLLFFRCPMFSDNDCELLINSLEHYLNIGKCKIFSVEIIDNESWNNYNIEPFERSKKHFEYNNFIVDEIVPLIYRESGGAVPIVTCGASSAAFHAANTFFRRPDIFLGTISMSGYYDIRQLSGDYFDDNCYFNSPCDYLPNLNDNYWLSFLLSRKHIYLSSGSGVGEYPENTRRLSEILFNKGILHSFEVWGAEWDHSVNTWINMMKYYLDNKL
ncbi:MAG TPA: esterase [Candidatus Kapabacteria bacterium]|nr:esterase [Candidatus Kapabacteria bacterium]